VGLEKRGLICVRGRGDGKNVLKITKKGEQRLHKYDFDMLRIKRPKKWDGKWRIVVFDIPEKKKRARDLINFKLKELGFYPFQISTFVLPYECKNEIDFIGTHLGIRKCINYILATEIDDERKLRSYFHLL